MESVSGMLLGQHGRGNVFRRYSAFISAFIGLGLSKATRTRASCCSREGGAGKILNGTISHPRHATKLVLGAHRRISDDV